MNGRAQRTPVRLAIGRVCQAALAIAVVVVASPAGCAGKTMASSDDGGTGDSATSVVPDGCVGSADAGLTLQSGPQECPGSAPSEGSSCQRAGVWCVYASAYARRACICAVSTEWGVYLQCHDFP